MTRTRTQASAGRSAKGMRNPFANRPREMYAGLAVLTVLACVAVMRGAPGRSFAVAPAVEAQPTRAEATVGVERFNRH